MQSELTRKLANQLTQTVRLNTGNLNSPDAQVPPLIAVLKAPWQKLARE